ncbi:hypothetical protein ACOME3_010822 [Neoechinorhynchus agilis]
MLLLRLLKERETGKFRRLATIGFTDERNAKLAVDGYDKSFIGNSRIRVELFVAEKDERAKPWSKYSQKKQDGDGFMRRRKMVDELLGDVKDDEGFKEFVREIKKIKGEKVKDEGGESNRFVERTRKVYPLKLFGLPFGAKKRQVKEFIKPVNSLKVIMVQRRYKSNCGVAIVWLRSEDEVNRLISTKNNHFLDGEKSRYIELKSLAPKVVVFGKKSIKALKEKKIDNKKELIVSDGGIQYDDRVIIKNLWYGSKEQDVLDLLKDRLSIKDDTLIRSIELPMSQQTDTIRGYALISFKDDYLADKACATIDGFIFQGRLLKVEKVISKDIKKKEEGKREVWSSLYVNTDTVASGIAKEFGVEKEAVYGSRDALAKLAIAEAKMVEELKLMMESQDLDTSLDVVSIANEAKGRSRKAILVKNLRSDYKESDAKVEFDQCGTVKRRALMKTSMTTHVLVEYTNESGASACFKECKKKGYHVEYAAVKPKETPSFSTKNDPVASTKILIKNVPFQVTTKDLKELFKVFGELTSNPRLPKKPTGGHRGFAFVEFVSIDDAKRAFEKLKTGTHLFGRRLVLEYAK